MKQVPEALLNYYASGETELAYGILIERAGPGEYNGQLYPDPDRPEYQLFGFTSYDKPATIDLTAWNFYGPDFETLFFTFDSVQGFDLSAIVSSGNLSVDNLEITTLDDGSFFNREDIIAGKWSNTFFRIFRYRTDLEIPDSFEDCETLFKGWFGEFKLTDTTITVELRNMTDALQQPIGEVSTKTCRNEFGDINCGITDMQYEFEITEVISQKEFYCADADTSPFIDEGGFFNNALLTFTSGGNSGLSTRVDTFEFRDTSTTFYLVTPMILPIQVGDTIRVNAGCDKTLNTCSSRFGNAGRFRGEPHRPTNDTLAK